MIFTGYFRKYQGDNGVSIAHKTPKWSTEEECKELMPPWEIVDKFKSGVISWKEFRKLYIKQLKKLDVHEMYRALNGKVLLCWENEDKKCHRHIVKEWFNRNGYACEELEAAKECYTCAYCKSLDNHSSSNIFCTKIGEIYSNSEQMSRTCDEWRKRV